LLDGDIDSGQLTDTVIDDFLTPISIEWNDTVTISGFVYTPVIHVPGVGEDPQYKVAPITDAVGWHIGSQNTRKQR
jgi:hypothetical protein